MPKPRVNHSREKPSAQPTMSLAPLVQVGEIPGPPGACSIIGNRQFRQAGLEAPTDSAAPAAGPATRFACSDSHYGGGATHAAGETRRLRPPPPPPPPHPGRGGVPA